MSFSGEVKEELVALWPSARHCMIAELSALFLFHGKLIRRKSGRYILRLQTENAGAAKKCFTLLKKTFNICTGVFLKVVPGAGVRMYTLVIDGQEDVERILGALKLGLSPEDSIALLTANACCRRAFIRGAFLASGSISDPQRSYHLEIVCDTQSQAEIVREQINSFFNGIVAAKIVSRKKYRVVYVKEGSQIVDTLNIMGAHVSLMEMENLRIVKEMRNSVNRRVNCETANINKTVSAAMKQVEDIRYIRDRIGFDGLSEPLRQMAELRLEYPEVSLKELGELVDPPVGKSGINHRLRKLCELAQELRERSASANEEQ